MFELKEGMKFKVFNKNEIYILDCIKYHGEEKIYIPRISGLIAFDEFAINREETAKLNGIDLLDKITDKMMSKEQLTSKEYKALVDEVERQNNKNLSVSNLKQNKEYNPKYDKDKLDWTLLPIKEIEEIVKVLNFGKQKYSANAWQGVENAQERYLSATYRHLVEYTKGNKIDEESGLSHLSHLATNIIFLMWFERGLNEKKN